MAEADLSPTLERAAPAVSGFVRADLRLTVEADLAVARLQILGDAPEDGLCRCLGGDPPAPRTQVELDGVTVAWLAPGEWLLTGIPGAIAAAIAAVACLGDMALAVDLSDGRVAFLLEGASARDAIAGVSALDVRDRPFPVGAVARTGLGATGMFVARLPDRGGAPCFRIVVDQTMATYAGRLLADPRREEISQ